MNLSTLFPVQNSWLLILGLLCAIFSIWLAYVDKYKAAVAILMIAGLCIRLFVAHADPFLHEWDERYHALVARNMMDNPFVPMLRNNPVIPYDFKNWSSNHIWLHKQPLFLWQIALSLKIFGVSAYAVRYPAVLMGTLMVPMVFRIGDLAVNNKKTAFIAAAMMCFCYYHLELIAGYYGMDQNDIAFAFYVLASIWAYAEYRQKLTWKWAILIGIFAGCAILNKWLTGLLVYAGWGVNILAALKNKEAKREILHLFVSVLTCTIIFLPWQLYILHRFPVEAAYEFAFNSKHLKDAVEGHSGTTSYYLDKFGDYYFGELIWLLLPAGILLLLFREDRTRLSVAIVAMFAGVFIFFSYIAATKIYAFFMIVVPLGFMFIAYCLMEIMTRSKMLKYAYVPLTVLTAFLIFKLGDVTHAHDARNGEWQVRAYNDKIFRNLKSFIPSDAQVISNIGSEHEIEAMFYNNKLAAYGRADLKLMKEKGMKIVFFKIPGEHDFAEDIKQYPRAIFVPYELKTYSY